MGSESLNNELEGVDGEDIDADDEETNVCNDCSTRDDLWICLICGHLGCGRYKAAHAHAHFTATNHLYAMELESQRVWDYAGDGLVVIPI